MIGELLIVITGFFRWAFKGFKTDLREEINGNENTNNRASNYIIGVVIFFLIILIIVIV